MLKSGDGGCDKEKLQAKKAKKEWEAMACRITTNKTIKCKSQNP